ncbi:MAG: hypothetical protein K8T89_04195 [Planctomycetes bacterium]|nr:hypothetical protein [Planctomycetota bacterium]
MYRIAAIGIVIMLSAAACQKKTAPPPKENVAPKIVEEPPKRDSPPKTESPATPAKAGELIVIDLLELNEDQFPNELARMQGSLDTSGIRVTPQGVFMTAAIAEETDAVALQKRGIEPGSAKLAPGKAKVLVVYRSQYQGKGRQWSSVTYHFFPELPAKIDLKPAVVGDTFKHDLTRDGPFELAILKIRLFPAGRTVMTTMLYLDTLLKDGGIASSYFGDLTVIPRDKPIELSREEKPIKIVQLAVTAEPLDGEPKSAPIEVIPKREQQQNFKTTVSAQSHGSKPIFILPEPKPLEAKGEMP